MTTFLGVLLGLMLPMAAPAQEGVDLGRDQTVREPRTDGASNNSVNRAISRQPGEDQEFARVPGDRATPRSEWKTGDQRGQPEGRRSKHKHTKNKKKRPSPRKTS
jgi:hypothetical protein